jgi:hypothetical protein
MNTSFNYTNNFHNSKIVFRLRVNEKIMMKHVTLVMVSVLTSTVLMTGALTYSMANAQIRVAGPGSGGAGVQGGVAANGDTGSHGGIAGLPGSNTNGESGANGHASNGANGHTSFGPNNQTSTGANSPPSTGANSPPSTGANSQPSNGANSQPSNGANSDTSDDN